MTVIDDLEINILAFFCVVASSQISPHSFFQTANIGNSFIMTKFISSVLCRDQMSNLRTDDANGNASVKIILNDGEKTGSLFSNFGRICYLRG